MTRAEQPQRRAYIGTREALEMVRASRPKPVTLATLLNWCRKYKLGRQLMRRGPWDIDRDKLKKFLEGMPE